MLRKKGLKYESRSSQTLRLLFPILWGLAQHFDESGLVLGEHDADYILHWAAVDWCRVAQLAQKIAPEGEKKTYSPAFCAQKGTFDRANTTFRILFPYKLNFDAIRPNLLLPVSIDISLPFLDLAYSLITGAGLLFKLFRQSIALNTKQAANAIISLAPYFTSNGSVRKAIQANIADDFTNRIIAESELSGVTWSISA